MTSTMAAKIAQETSHEVIEAARRWLLKQFQGHADVVASLSDAEVIYWTAGYYGSWEEFLEDRK